MEYEWDNRKAAANEVKHGASFAMVADFEWSKARILPDLRLRRVPLQGFGHDRHAALCLDLHA
jgi:uncharacterized DUF497 family protein